jgi:uncharacterized protein YraI
MLKLAIAALFTATLAAVAPATSAGASTAPATAGVVGHTTTLCRYQVSGLRPGGRLNVRSGPGTRYRVIATFRAHAWLSGPCHARYGWVRVVRGKHRNGWVSRHYLARR